MAQLKGDFLLVLVTLAAAAGWLFSQQVLQEITPQLFMAVRFLTAGILLSLFLNKQLRGFSRQQWCMAIFLGFILALPMVAWVKGLAVSKHLGESAFICSLAVVFVPFAGRIIYATKLLAIQLIPLLFSIAGLAALAFEGGFNVEASQLYLLLAAVIFSAQFVMTAQHTSTIPPMALAAIQMLVVGIVTAVMALLTEPLVYTWSASTWNWLIASITVASLLRFALQNYALKFTSANNAGMVMVLEPVWTAILGGWYLGQTLAPNQWLGCGLIFMAIMIYQCLRYWQWRKILKQIKCTT